MRWPPWLARARASRIAEPEAQRIDAAEVLYVPAEGGDVALVCGLQWHTILGDDLHIKARNRARSLRASHWVHAGGRSESVGVAALPRRALLRQGRKLPAHAAAQLFARSVSAGVHALGWELPGGRCWLVVARDGQVLGQGDLVLPDAEAASAALDSWRGRFGSALQCHGRAAIWQAAGQGASPSDPVPGLAELLAVMAPSSALQVVPPHWRRLPLPVVLLMLLCIAVLAMQGWWKMTRPAVPSSVLLSDDAASSLDAEAQWRAAVATQRAALSAVAPEGMQALWRGLGELPAHFAGWRLQGLDCERTETRWQCAARIRRSAPHARVDELADATAGMWALTWSDLDHATGAFEVITTITGIQTDTVGAQPGLVPEADTLQAVRPSLHRIELGPSTVIAVPAHLLAQAGLASRPAHLPVLAQRSLALHGPWRSLVLAAELLGPGIAWQRFTVDLDDVRSPTLRQSAFLASLYGVRYENQTPATSVRRSR